jgi:hypothetical protein
MADIETELELDAENAGIAAAEAYETDILDFAQAQLNSGEQSIANALEGGFRAKVPLIGGDVAAAIGTAIAQLEPEQVGELKAIYDGVLAKLKADAAAKAAALAGKAPETKPAP